MDASQLTHNHYECFIINTLLNHIVEQIFYTGSLQLLTGLIKPISSINE